MFAFLPSFDSLPVAIQFFGAMWSLAVSGEFGIAGYTFAGLVGISGAGVVGAVAADVGESFARRRRIRNRINAMLAASARHDARPAAPRPVDPAELNRAIGLAMAAVKYAKRHGLPAAARSESVSLLNAARALAKAGHNGLARQTLIQAAATIRGA